MPKSKYILQRNCENCGNMFNAKTIYSKYCSEKCSDAAGRKRKKQEALEVRNKQLVDQIPTNRPYITIAEAVLIFGVSRDTIYRQIRKGKIPVINLGKRLTRINRIHIEALFPKVETMATKQFEPENNILNYDKNECYSIGEITEKFGISASTVNKTIRNKSIPKKQIGKFVYVPKIEIDNLFGAK